MSQLVNQAGQKIAFPASGDALAIGRGAESCRVLKTLRGYFVQGSAATNVLVNGQKVQEHLLKDGDVIQLGASSYTFYTGNPPAAAPAPAAAAPAKDTARRVPPGAGPKPTTQRVVASAPVAAGPRPTQRVAAAAPAPAQPATRSGQRPATGTHQKPATGTHAKPATGAHARPASAPATAAGVKTATERVKTTTDRMKTGTDKVGKATGSVATRPSTGRFKPGTQRIEGQPKPTTGRHRPGGPPSSRRVQVSKPGGGIGAIIPKTTKGRIIVASALLGLGAVIAVLTILFLKQPNPPAIQAALKAEIAEVIKIPDDPKILEKEARCQPIKDNADYKRFANDILKPFEREMERIAGAAKLHREARSACGAFLEKKWAPVKDSLAKLPRDDAQRLYDESKPLADSYGEAITVGPQITEAFQKLKDRLQNEKAKNWELDLPKLKTDINQLEGQGNYGKALQINRDFGTEYEAGKIEALGKQLGELAVQTTRRANEFVTRLIREADAMKTAGQRTEGKAKLEAAKAGLQGSDAINRLDEAIRNF